MEVADNGIGFLGVFFKVLAALSIRLIVAAKKGRLKRRPSSVI